MKKIQHKRGVEYTLGIEDITKFKTFDELWKFVTEHNPTLSESEIIKKLSAFAKLSGFKKEKTIEKLSTARRMGNIYIEK